MLGHGDRNCYASQEIGFLVNALSLFMSCHHSAGQKQSIKIVNTSFENIAELQYVGTAIT
jgi:hypothetical protein